MIGVSPIIKNRMGKRANFAIEIGFLDPAVFGIISPKITIMAVMMGVTHTTADWLSFCAITVARTVAALFTRLFNNSMAVNVFSLSSLSFSTPLAQEIPSLAISLSLILSEVRKAISAAEKKAETRSKRNVYK